MAAFDTHLSASAGDTCERGDVTRCTPMWRTRTLIFIGARLAGAADEADEDDEALGADGTDADFVAADGLGGGSAKNVPNE